MTHDRDLDRTLAHWMDDGPTVVADRVIDAALTDVHTTRQRGARWAPLKELFMTIKPATTLLVVAIVASLGIATYQLWARGQIGSTPEPHIFTASELPDIVMNADEAPPGMDLDGLYIGDDEVLLRPVYQVEGPDADAFLDQPGFLGGRYTEFSHERAGVLSWVALFATTEEAERALALYGEYVQSGDSYGFTSRVDAALGDGGAFYSEGSDPEFNAQAYLWRIGNLVLAAATYGEFDAEELGQLAEGMDDRAR